jgi:hypothetical protein
LKKNKNQNNGIKQLAVWKAAESKAASVLDVLVRNGYISNAEKNLNLNEATLAIVENKQWEHIFASARANASNEMSKKSAELKKEKLFSWLDSNLKEYKTLDEAAEAAFEAKAVTLGVDRIRQLITLYRKGIAGK